MKKAFMLFTALFPMSVMATTVSMYAVDQYGVGETIGTVMVSESDHGLVLKPNLYDLTPGLHGFHLHQNPSCEPKIKQGYLVPALSAGGHYDPQQTAKHGTPWGEGHLGDLPFLYVNTMGHADEPILAPRLKMSDIKGRSFVIHAGSDNYSDYPKALGGGGKRVACGVIE